MKFSISIAATILAATTTTVLARPGSIATSSQVEARAFKSLPGDPDMVPVTVNDLAEGATMTCGSTTFTQTDIYKAVSWGDILQDNNLARGRKSTQFPNGRFPHSYTNTQYTFNGDCPADDNRQEYPLIVAGPYNGSPQSNTNWGQHRVIYYREPGEIGSDGHDLVYFCGGVTHEGAAQGAFLQCTVNNPSTA